MGLGIVDRRFGGEVIRGGKAVWLAEEPGDGTAGGDVVGDVEDMIVVIIRVGDNNRGVARLRSCPERCRWARASADLPTQCAGNPSCWFETRRSHPQASGVGGSERRGDRSKSGERKQRQAALRDVLRNALGWSIARNNYWLSLASIPCARAIALRCIRPGRFVVVKAFVE